MAQQNLIGLPPDRLNASLLSAGVAPKMLSMRARQLWNWIYVHGARNFDDMSNLAKDFRLSLSEKYAVDRPAVVTQQISTDGTHKWLLRGEDRAEYETVFIPEPGRGTLCISSQVGCTLNCRFCHTGTQRLVRNLTAGDNLGQLMLAPDAPV